MPLILGTSAFVASSTVDLSQKSNAGLGSGGRGGDVDLRGGEEPEVARALVGEVLTLHWHRDEVLLRSDATACGVAA